MVSLGLGGICLDVRLSVVDFEVVGTALVATVTNIGPYPAGVVQVFWHGTWEPRDDSPLIGTGFGFVTDGKQPNLLQPGESREFALWKPHLKKALSYAAALSSVVSQFQFQNSAYA